MSRLTKRIDENTMCIEVCEKECVEGYTFCPKCKPFGDVMKKLLHYEDLEEQGRLIELPCMLGDTVWLVRDGKIEETTAEKIVLRNDGLYLLYLKLFCNSFYETTCRSIGKTVFLTKEEADARLKELKGGDE